MRSNRSPDILRQVQTLFGPGAAAGVPDAALLERFVRRKRESAEALAAAEAAFEALVARHGPMVLGVCRRALTTPADVDDAFQATFLILVRKAGSVHVDGSLGRWLYGVARKVAARARRRAERQRRRTSSLATDPEAPASGGERDELTSVLDQEISRLPLRYRAPVILCHFEGLTQAEAAVRLHCPVGTVSGRLTRARGLLRERLVRRGVTMSAGALASYLEIGEARAAVPQSLVHTTTHAAATLATTGVSSPGIVSAAALSLMNEAVRTATAIRLGLAAAIVLAMGLAGYTAAEVRGQLAGSMPPAQETQADTAEGAGANLTGRPISNGENAETPAKHRPADEIVAEIEATLTKVRTTRGTGQVWRQGHAEVARLVEELRSAYPEDARLAVLLLNRWASLSVIGRPSVARDEAITASRKATDPAVRRSALFYQAECRTHEGIGSLAAVADAEEFARQAPGDLRAAMLLDEASKSLDYGTCTRLGLAAASLLAALAFATTFRVLRLAIRVCEMALASLLAILIGIQLVEDGGLPRVITNTYEKINVPERVQRMAVLTRSLETQAWTCLYDMPRPVEAFLLLSLAAAMAAGALALMRRQRRSDVKTTLASSLRRPVIAFLLALSTVCLADAGRLFHKQKSLIDRVAREYPDGLQARCIRGQRSQVQAETRTLGGVVRSRG